MFCSHLGVARPVSKLNIYSYRKLHSQLATQDHFKQNLFIYKCANEQNKFTKT